MPTDKKPKPQIKKVANTAAAKDSKFASVGKYTIQDDKGQLVDDSQVRSRMAGLRKTADLLEGNMGYSNIADSNNMGFYNYEFPVDSLELPQSRPEELRFYTIAYDRDPIVARAIDLHTEIPMSKINLEKPKCSSQEFADYVFDYYQGFTNRVKLFEQFLHGTRQYFQNGEAFLYVEDDPDIEPCPEAKREIQKGINGKKQNPDLGRGPSSETSFNPASGTDELGIMSTKRSSQNPVVRLSSLLKVSSEHVLANIDRLSLKAQLAIMDTEESLSQMKKNARVVTRRDNTMKTGQPPTGDNAAGAPDNAPAPGGEELVDTPPEGGDAGGDLGDLGGGAPPSGGGGGGIPGLEGTPLGDNIDEAVAGNTAEGLQIDPERLRMERYLKMLKKQKDLLEELKGLRDNRNKDKEIFAHVTNKDYSGPDRIQLLPPETVEIQVDPMNGPQIFFKPSEQQKQIYLDSPDVDPMIKQNLEENGVIPLNNDPLKGSYIIHFARKKAPFEPHGRSILQRCMRTILYRDKLRQVQTTLASRNMTPKTLICAPNVPQSELLQLRAHVDEAKSDPDYTVIVNYDCTWNEIGSEGRLLALDSEWSHTNSDLACGLGFTPDILTGEGMYANSRIQLEILNTTYLQFRDIISGIIEDLIFRPIAMKKGFYEIDKYGRPRWIYPKITFARMALRDSSDLYEMLYNLYVKGSIPIDIILEFLSIDPESCKQRLEEDLFTVNDSKFNEFLTSFYNSLAGNENLINKTDVIDKMMKSMGLKEKDSEDEKGLEGTGEGQ